LESRVSAGNCEDENKTEGEIEEIAESRELEEEIAKKNEHEKTEIEADAGDDKSVGDSEVDNLEEESKELLKKLDEDLLREGISICGGSGTRVSPGSENKSIDAPAIDDGDGKGDTFSTPYKKVSRNDKIVPGPISGALPMEVESDNVEPSVD